MKFKDIRATIEIDLKKSEQELWDGLDKDARWGVNKAKKSGLSVKVCELEENWEEFYQIYKDTIIRGGIVPKDKLELKKETDMLFICLFNKKVIAGAAIKIKDKKMELFLNASMREYLTLQPNNLLYWSIISWGKENDYLVFDLGGYQLNAKKGDKLYEVNRFKERWGGEIKTYEVYSKNPFYIIGRKVIRNLHWVKNIRDKLKLYFYRRKDVENVTFFEKVWRLIYDKREMVIFSKSLNKINLIKPDIPLDLKQTDLEELEKIKNQGYPVYSKFKKRLEREDECFFYFDGKIPVHSSWVTYRVMDISEISKKIPLNESEACIYDCYTVKEYRGKNIYPAMLSNLQNYLKNKNFKKCYIYAEPRNVASIKGIEKAGFREDKKIECLNILGFKRRRDID